MNKKIKYLNIKSLKWIIKISIIMSLLLVFNSCKPNYTKRDLIGVYIANKFMKTKDIIIITDTNFYIHEGYRVKDSSYYSDTGRWGYNQKSKSLYFYGFCNHYFTKTDVDLDTLSYVFCTRIIKRKGEINLVVSTDAGQYYVKQ
jgi:hypothetical protein